MQKHDIQLPPGDLIDLWGLARQIALSLCPSLREAVNHRWIKLKREIRPDSMFEAESELTDAERDLVLRLVPSLPSSPDLSEEQRRSAMDAFLSHPERPNWRPVLVSPDEVTANGFEIIRIQDMHLRALQQEIEAGEIRALDRHHIGNSRAGMNVFIHRADALRYLDQHCLRTTEDAAAAPQTRLPTRGRDNGASQETVRRRSLPKEGAVAKPQGPTNTAELGNDECARPALASHTSAMGDHQTTIRTLSIPAAPKTRSKSIENLPATDEIIAAPVSILRRQQVEARTALSRSAIYDKLDPRSPRHDPTFPKQVNLGTSSVGWIANEIDAWLLSRKRVTR